MGWGETLQRVAANQYYDLQGDTMTFANNNGVMHLTLPIPGEVYFSGDRLQPLHLSAAELSNFTGSFHSEELDTLHAVSRRRTPDGEGSQQPADPTRCCRPRRVLLQRSRRFCLPS